MPLLAGTDTTGSDCDRVGVRRFGQEPASRKIAAHAALCKGHISSGRLRPCTCRQSICGRSVQTDRRAATLAILDFLPFVSQSLMSKTCRPIQRRRALANPKGLGCNLIDKGRSQPSGHWLRYLVKLGVDENEESSFVMFVDFVAYDHRDSARSYSFTICSALCQSSSAVPAQAAARAIRFGDA